MPVQDCFEQRGNGDVIPYLIPRDFVVNSIIVAAASVASSYHKELKIVNCTSTKPPQKFLVIK